MAHFITDTLKVLPDIELLIFRLGTLTIVVLWLSGYIKRDYRKLFGRSMRQRRPKGPCDA